MIFKKLSNSMSPILILEDLKKFWFISLLGFLAYFYKLLAPILMNYNQLEKYNFSLEYFFYLRDPEIKLISCLLPLFAAGAVFKYLQIRKESLYMHSLPFSRNQLFFSHLSSGLIIGLLPVTITWILLHILSKPVLLDNQNIFSHNTINLWFLGSLLYFFMVYSFVLLSAGISGNLLMQLALSIAIGFVPFALYRCIGYFFTSMLRGTTFDWDSTTYFVLENLNPFNFNYSLLNIYKWHNDIFTIILSLNIAVVLLSLYLAYMLYKHRKLERTGDMIVYPIVAEGLLYLSAFCGSVILVAFGSELSLSALDFYGNKIYLTLSYLGFGILTFILAGFVIYKSLHIFRKINLKRAAIFGILYLLILTAMSLDILGIEQKIPPSEALTAVHTDVFNNIYEYSRDIREDERFSYLSAFNSDGYGRDTMIFQTKENIEAMRSLHKTVVSDLAAHSPFSTVPHFKLEYLNKSKDDPFMHRLYGINMDDLENYKDLKHVFESQEFKEKYSLKHIAGSVEYLSLNICDFIDAQNIPVDAPVTIYEPTEISALISALDADFQEMSYENFLSRKTPLFRVDVVVSGENNSINNFRFLIYPDDKKALALIESKSYFEHMHISTDDIDKITVKQRRLLKTETRPNGRSSSSLSELSTIVEVSEPGEIEALHRFFNKPSIVNGYSIETDLEIRFKGYDRVVSGTIHYPLEEAPEFLKENMNIDMDADTDLY